MPGLKTLDASNFTLELQRAGVALILFVDQWCPPWENLDAVLSDIASQYQEIILVGQVDVDQSPEIAVNQGIFDLPTLIFYQASQEVERLFGSHSRNTLVERLSHILQ
ncbi:MAG: thioredoxin family protein [Planctomycetota bacterium]|jgi:thioredoxin 1|nr:thioredoxin family protein [Planctomycetota bacterium]